MSIMSLTHSLKAVRAIEPDAYGTGAQNGVAIDCRGFGQALFVLNLGTLGASATIDCKVQESADGSTGWADVTGAAFTQKTQAGTDASDKTFQLSVSCEARKRYLRPVLTVGVATSDAGVTCILGDAQSKPITTEQAEDGGHVAA